MPLAAPFAPETVDDGGVYTPAEVCGQPCRMREAADLPASVYVCGECASSLDMAHALGRGGQLPVWGSVLAAGQSAGRGQLGRVWHSPPGNVFAALRLPLEPPFTETAAAPALGALIIAALHDLGYAALLKWPNDIVVHDGGARKAGGVLLEEREGRLVAGIGLNLVAAPPATALRERHALPGGCLRGKAPVPPRPAVLWARLVSRMKFWYDHSPHPEAPAAFAARWQALAERFLLHLGCEVTLIDGADEAERLRGIVVGLGPDGGLRLRADGAIRTVHSGSLV